MSFRCVVEPEWVLKEPRLTEDSWTVAFTEAVKPFARFPPTLRTMEK